MDLNTLISTIVAATAALVAIIGGFLVSRVLSLSSERIGIERRLNEINNDISAKNEMLDRVKESLVEEDADEFIRSNHEELITESKSLEQLVDENDTPLTLEDLKPFVEEFQNIKEEVISIINGYHSKTVPSDFNKIIKGRSDLKYPNRMIWYELIYDVIYNVLDEEEDTSNPFGIKLPSLDIPTINPYLMTSPADLQRYRDMENEYNRLKDELHILGIQKEEQHKILNDYGTPKGLWGGLGVLIYACIVGIAYPSTLLPYPVDFYDDERTKWLLLGLFYSELVAIFLYLSVNLRRFTRITKKLER